MCDSSPYRELYHRSILPLWGDGPGSIVPVFVPETKGGLAFDLGCGDGRNLIWLASNGYSVKAFDVEPLAIERALARCEEARVLDRIELNCENVADLDSPIEKADVIVSYGLFHCLDENSLANTVKFIDQSVRKGGIVVCAMLTNGVDIPEDHGTTGIYLRSARNYFERFSADWKVLYKSVDILRERHDPVIGWHEHEILRFVLKLEGTLE